MNVFLGCVSNCFGVADGLYPSCFAYNVYIDCEGGGLTYKSCADEYGFDKDASSCVVCSPECTGKGYEKTILQLLHKQHGYYNIHNKLNKLKGL